MKIIFSVIFLTIIIFVFFPLEEIKTEIVKPSEIEISFNVVGDLMVHSIQRQYAKTDSIYNFDPVFREVKSILSSADITIGNLETVISGKDTLSGYPRFNAPESFLSALNNTGFDLLYLSNNHMLDYGSNGLEETLNKINSLGIISAGVSSSEDSTLNIKIINSNGLKIAFLAYTYRTNLGSAKKTSRYSVNRIDSAKIVEDIAAAKSFAPDLVTVYYHFGTEYKRSESNYQKKYERIAIEAGADIILASHPHVIQPIKFFKSEKAKTDSGFTAYSLGNFVSNQRWRYSDGGVILNFTVIKDLAARKTKVKEINYLPVWVYKGTTGKKNEFVIIPESGNDKNVYPGYLTDEDFEKMIQHFSDTKSVITKYSKSIKLYQPVINNLTLADN